MTPGFKLTWLEVLEVAAMLTCITLPIWVVIFYIFGVV